MTEILVLTHYATPQAGIYLENADHGARLTEFNVSAGQEMPDLAAFDALWVMGGAMNVWEEDRYPWLTAEKDYIRHAVGHLRMPYLGICLGHQLLADAMGGTVRPTEQFEIGFVDIAPTEVGRDHPILDGLPDPSSWANYHVAEVTAPPPGAAILAASSKCGNHMMQFGENAYSCQFHPEIRDGTFEEWAGYPGVADDMNRRLGHAGVEALWADLTRNMADHNDMAVRLFRNWLKTAL